VSQYAMLQKLDADAWKTVAASFSFEGLATENDDVAEIATPVANRFAEGLLRNMLDLQPDQQIKSSHPRFAIVFSLNSLASA